MNPSVTTPESSPVLPKVNLLGMTRAQLEEFFVSIGEKKFRATQIIKWIHQLGVDNFEEMSNVSKALCAKLEKVAEIRPPEVVYKEFSNDGTRKWVLKVGENSMVETVLIPDGDRKTLCLFRFSRLRR